MRLSGPAAHIAHHEAMAAFHHKASQKVLMTSHENAMSKHKLSMHLSARDMHSKLAQHYKDGLETE